MRDEIQKYRLKREMSVENCEKYLPKIPKKIPEDLYLRFSSDKEEKKERSKRVCELFGSRDGVNRCAQCRPFSFRVLWTSASATLTETIRCCGGRELNYSLTELSSGNGRPFAPALKFV